LGADGGYLQQAHLLVCNGKVVVGLCVVGAHAGIDEALQLFGELRGRHQLDILLADTSPGCHR
jgi:hypothetical protein